MMKTCIRAFKLTITSALGLAPPNASSALPYSAHPSPNILSHLLAQAPLAKKLLSFTLPANLYTGVKGSITLGALPAGHDNLEQSIPMGDLSKGWNVPLSRLNLEAVEESTATDAELDLKGLALFPSLSASGLALPSNLTEKLYPHLHALPDSGWLDGRDFNCSFRGHLPNLTFTFPTSSASSKDASISFAEKDYTLHGYAGEEEICLLTISPHEDEERRGLERVVEVGTPLWRGWHVVFDLEGEGEGEGEMGLVERDREDDDDEAEAREFDFTRMRKRKGFH